MSEIEIKNNRVDYITSLLKGLGGAIPLAGGIVAEVVGAVIPEQRVDRIARFLEVLSRRLDEIDKLLLKERLSSSNGVSLLEESMLLAYRARTDERRGYIANVVATGISGEQIKVMEAERMLSILAQLSDPEIIVLQSYGYRGFKHYPFSRIHHDLLYPEIPVLTDPPHVRDSYAVRQSYDDHLEGLGLIESKLVVEEDRRGESKVIAKNREITGIGFAFLKWLGLETLE